MNTLTERYHAMPDELLLKTLAQREKYNEEAVQVAIAEAEARGLTVPDTSTVIARPEQKGGWRKQFLQMSRITGRVGENDDLLDADAIRESISPDRLALKLTLTGFVLLFVLELIGNWIHFSAIRYGFDWSTFLLFLPVLITGCVVLGIWKGFRPAFYLGAGLIVTTSLVWLVDIYSLFREPSHDLSGLMDGLFSEYHTVYSLWFVLMIFKVVVLIGTGWLLFQRSVYRYCGMKYSTVPLAFLFGAIGLLLFNYLVGFLVAALFS